MKFHLFYFRHLDILLYAVIKIFKNIDFSSKYNDICHLLEK